MDATFNIKVKKMDNIIKWEPNFLQNQIAHPWLDAGYVIWNSNTYYSKMCNIEKL